MYRRDVKTSCNANGTAFGPYSALTAIIHGDRLIWNLVNLHMKNGYFFGPPLVPMKLSIALNAKRWTTLQKSVPDILGSHSVANYLISPKAERNVSLLYVRVYWKLMFTWIGSSMLEQNISATGKMIFHSARHCDVGVT